MRFEFSQEQFQFRDAVRDVLAKTCQPGDVREAWNNQTGRAPSAWAALHDMGVLAMLAPTEAGGLGLTELDIVLILEETGRCALPEPIVETALIAAPEGWVNGTDSASVSLPESPFGVWTDTCASVVTLTADGVRVAPRESVRLTQRESVDGARRLFAIDMGSTAPIAPVTSTALAFRRGVLGTSAQLLGLADRMIEMTVDYVKEREQFGVKIGTFQAVKHHLANARTKLEFARPLTYRAAASLASRDALASQHVSMAKVQSSDAASLAARVALQCHGAIGYTTECDLHLFMKRSWALERAWGAANWHRRMIAQSLFERL